MPVPSHSDPDDLVPGLVSAAGPSSERWSETLADRLKIGAALNLLGTAFNQGSTLLVNIAVANVLGREIFGQYTIVMATIAAAATLAQLSMGYTATKYVAELRSTDPVRTSRILGLCGAVSILAAFLTALALVISADWLARRVLDAAALAPLLRIAAAAVFCTVLNGYFSGALAGLERYRAIAANGITSGSIYALVCIGLAWTNGLTGAVTGVAISAFVQSALLGILLRRQVGRFNVSLTHRDLWQERRVISRFAVPASLAGFITLPAVWISSALLARQPGGFDQLALFGAANSFRLIVMFVPQAINSVTLSLLNNQRRSSEEGYRRVFSMNLVASVTTALVLSCLMLVAASPLLRLFGGDFVEGRGVLMILLGVAVVEAIALAWYQVIVSHGRMWASLLAVAVPRDGTLVVMAAVLTPVLGAVGLATAHATGSVLALVSILILASRLGNEPSRTLMSTR